MNLGLINILNNNFVTFHSGSCIEGSVFVAVRGEKVDGHSYLSHAKKNGAKYALVEHGYSGDSFGLKLLPVENPLYTLQAAAKEVMAHRRTIGITGSCGKTTTKEFLSAMLATKYKVGKTEGNRNSQISLPTDILNMDDGCDFYVMEMGMSKPREMRRLVDMMQVEIAAITMIGRAHIEFFKSQDDLAYAKGEILVHPKTKVGYLGSQVYSFPFVPKMGTCKKVRVEYQEKPLLHLLPKHLQEDALLALAIAKDLGVDEDAALQSIQGVQDKRRFYLHETGGVHWITDAYNAIPEAVIAALRGMPDIGARRGAILGDMRELGTSSEAAHKEVGRVAAEMLDFLLCFGEPMKIAHRVMARNGKESHWFPSRAHLLDEFSTLVYQNDLVLVKGSNTEQLWELPKCYCT